MKEIKRYLHIYGIIFKHNLTYIMTYRFSFFIEVCVEIFYNLIYIVFFNIIYANVQSIKGWSHDEMLFLIGLDIITAELMVGLIFARNINNLPELIKDGEIDLFILKPYSSMFNLTISQAYAASFIGMIPGFYLITTSLIRLGIPFNPLNILCGLILLICGMIISYSVAVLISSLSFVFINAKTFPRVGMESITDFSGRPHQIYQGIAKIVFFFLVPVVFVTSIPASTFIRGVEWQYLILGVTLAAIFLYCTIKFWNIMIRNYTSASS